MSVSKDSSSHQDCTYADTKLLTKSDEPIADPKYLRPSLQTLTPVPSKMLASVSFKSNQHLEALIKYP